MVDFDAMLNTEWIFIEIIPIFFVQQVDEGHLQSSLDTLGVELVSAQVADQFDSGTKLSWAMRALEHVVRNGNVDWPLFSSLFCLSCFSC